MLKSWRPSRRELLARSVSAAAGVGLGFSELAAAEPSTGTFLPPGAVGGSLKKALIVNRPTEDVLKRLKDRGFDGVEAGVLDPSEAEKCRLAAERTGMRVHAVLRGWAEFNSSDASKVQASIERTEAALRAAQAFGADAVLLVPCRVGGLTMPRPWEFHIDFDKETGHIRAVTVGDNSAFEDYIRAHNHATDTSRDAIQRLIPVAERTGVVLALENVWNNLWVRPAIFHHFVASFDSRWVKTYFDIGNHVKYRAPEAWILELGDSIVKCHVKDFLLNPSDSGGGGKFVNIREGSVRWPVVRAALARVGYEGWMTIEGGDLSEEEHSRRLDQIIDGD